MTIINSTDFKNVIHGATVRIISRMKNAPGRFVKLNFKNPIYTPVSLDVKGTLIKDFGDYGQVSVVISDAKSGERLVEGSYEFGKHSVDLYHTDMDEETDPKMSLETNPSDARVLITGAGVGLGSALMRQSEFKYLGLSRNETAGLR